MKKKCLCLFGAVLLVSASSMAAESQASTNAATEPRLPRGRAITLRPDDQPAFAEPPADIVTKRDGIPRGRLELIEYDSTTVGNKRKLQIYTPPGYSRDKQYPVLYLLHGIGGDETEWQRFATPDAFSAESTALVFP